MSDSVDDGLTLSSAAQTKPHEALAEPVGASDREQGSASEPAEAPAAGRLLDQLDHQGLIDHAAEVLATVDLSRYVASSLGKRVGKLVDDVVADALAEAMTPERRQLLKEMADDLVDKALKGEGPAPAEEEQQPELHFPNVYRFVDEFLVKVYARPVRTGATFKWCEKWWEHPEAVSRLEALWLAFETLRNDPGTGAGVWWRDYCDPTMHALGLSDEGPFSQCNRDHTIHQDLPSAVPHEYLYNDGVGEDTVTETPAGAE